MAFIDTNPWSLRRQDGGEMLEGKPGLDWTYGSVLLPVLHCVNMTTVLKGHWPD